MDFHVENLGPCRKQVKVTISPERVLEEFDKQYDEINDNVALPGFRKGRAPRRVLEKRFGPTLGREVKQKLVETALERLVEDKKVEPLRAPDLEIEELELVPEKAFEFEFEVVTRPEFETPAYEGLEVEIPAVVVTDEYVDQAIEGLRRSEAVLQTVEDAKVEADDILVVDWQALDGDSVEAHDDNAYYPFGRGVLSGFVADGLDEQFEGKPVGTKARAKARVAADDPREELRDRELDLEVELKEIKRYVLPEIDEEFLKRHDYDDVDEMRDEAKKQLRRGRERERDSKAEATIVERLSEGVEMSLPEEFVEQELESWARRRRMSLEYEGVDEAEIEKRIDQERADAQTNVERDMRKHFLLDRIAEAEEVKVAEADLLQAIQSIARAYGRPEEEVLSSFREPGRMAELHSQVLHGKTRDLLRRKTKLVETEAQEEQPAETGNDA